MGSLALTLKGGLHFCISPYSSNSCSSTIFNQGLQISHDSSLTNLVTGRSNGQAFRVLGNSNVTRIKEAAAVQRGSDLEMGLMRRRMLMNGGMPLMISIPVASLFTISSLFASASASTPEAAFVKETISSHNIVIFSKSHCPYCKRAKAVFKELNQAPHVIELDERDDGWDVKDALSEIVGRHTVPQVFVNGKHIGGSDDTVEAYESGKLAKLLGVAKDDL